MPQKSREGKTHPGRANTPWGWHPMGQSTENREQKLGFPCPSECPNHWVKSCPISALTLLLSAFASTQLSALFVRRAQDLHNASLEVVVSKWYVKEPRETPHFSRLIWPHCQLSITAGSLPPSSFRSQLLKTHTKNISSFLSAVKSQLTSTLSTFDSQITEGLFFKHNLMLRSPRRPQNKPSLTILVIDIFELSVCHAC